MAIELPDPASDLGQTLQQALLPGENILAAVLSGYGSGAVQPRAGVLAVTDRGVVIAKQGKGMLGTGYQSSRYPYNQIIGMEVTMQLFVCYVEIRSLDTANHPKEIVWGGRHTEIRDRGQNLLKEPNALLFKRERENAFRQIVAVIQDQIAQLGRPASQPQPAADIPEQIKKLAALRDAGVISQEEFEAKKAELLARM
jgi:hypothetical protein